MEELIYTVYVNESVFEIVNFGESGFCCGYLVELDDKSEWYIFANEEDAGETTKEYWKDMAENDPKEFAWIIGEETLIQWGLGQYAGPGYEKVKSLEEWLNLTAEYPEEQWADYDGFENYGRISKSFQKETGLPHEVVMYRWS